ncbi:c-type cytochrome [Pseudomonas aeruginosa]
MKRPTFQLIPIVLLTAGTASVLAAGLPADPPPGRLLASQCFQCHGTNGRSQSSIDSINDMKADELFKELREMKASTKVKVMEQQAKVYTDAELRLIADFLGRR